MNLFSRFLNKKNNELCFFAFNKKVYVIGKNNSKYTYGISQDGFSFQETSKEIDKINEVWRVIKRKRLIESEIFRSSLSIEGEKINSSNLRIEGIVKGKTKTKVFFDYQKELGIIEAGVVVLDNKNLTKILWWGMEPVWKSPKKWIGKETKLVGFFKFNRKILAYWQVKDLGIIVVSYPDFKVNQKIKIKNGWRLERSENNPLLSPIEKNDWEAFTTFNPAAIYLADKVHILYRAQGFDYRSVLGYANSSDGIMIEERLDQPAYLPRKPFEKRDIDKKVVKEFMSGGGYDGCEDPRIVCIDNKIYMTYVAFDGYNPPRIALSSIKLTDFLKKRWLWSRPVLISPPGVIDKSACILPKKINGKYVIFHRIFPNILIDYVDNLDFNNGRYLQGKYKISPRSPMWWDSRKIGVAAPPILTKDGWLLIYQAVDDKNAGHYKVGAMMLKADEPQVELYRSQYPIMEPDEWYENNGFKAGVVYPCGAVIINNQLFVYYGGADKYVCVATTNLDNFLDKLKCGGQCKLEGTVLGIIK